MRRFKSAGHAQRFVEVHGIIATRMAVPERAIGTRRAAVPSRMTLGERVQLLEKLDVKLGTALSQSMGVRRRRVLGKGGIQLLHSISSNRSLFTHPKRENAQPEFDLSRLDGHQITEWVAHAAEFCNSDLVTMIIATQESKKEASRAAP